MANERPRAADTSGWGRYAPSRVLTNEKLSRMVDTSEEWVWQRTGILERGVAGSRKTTASLNLRAAWAALDVAGLAAYATLCWRAIVQSRSWRRDEKAVFSWGGPFPLG
jgi:hypothetical protein